MGTKCLVVVRRIGIFLFLVVNVVATFFFYYFNFIDHIIYKMFTCSKQYNLLRSVHTLIFFLGNMTWKMDQENVYKIFNLKLIWTKMKNEHIITMALYNKLIVCSHCGHWFVLYAKNIVKENNFKILFIVQSIGLKLVRIICQIKNW